MRVTHRKPAEIKNCRRAAGRLFAASLLLLAIALVRSVSAPASVAPLAQRTGFFFDTVITISMYDTDDAAILDKCFEQMEYYESIFSRTKEGSDVWRINHARGKSVEVAEETADLIGRALQYCELSHGALDITIAPVVDLWDFHEDAEPALPSQEDLKSALQHVDYTKVELDGTTVTLQDPEAEIDLGAIAKGYISDGAAQILRSEGCKSALIDLGGNIYAVGEKPDGTPFRIGIRKPFGESAMDIVEVVEAADGSVITSGTYERYFEIDGKLYHHILDTKTGMSVENGLDSVSIRSPEGTDGDALSTTCFALGLEEGMELIESLDGIEALFIDHEGEMYKSSGW